MSLPFCARRACGTFPPPADGEIPRPETAYCFATRVHHETAAEERAAARKGRIASRLVCTGERLLRIDKSKSPEFNLDLTRFLFCILHNFRKIIL